MPEKLKSPKDIRQEKEKELTEKNEEIKFPEWEVIEAERRNEQPEILLNIRDNKGKTVNAISGTNEKGFNRVTWKLNHPDKSGESFERPKIIEGSVNNNEFLVTPGEYTVTLSKRVDGLITELDEPRDFTVIPLDTGVLKGASSDEIDLFREQYQIFQQDLAATNSILSKKLLLVDAMKRAFDKSSSQIHDLSNRIHQARGQLLDIEKELNGDKSKMEIGERVNPMPKYALLIGRVALRPNTYGPTANHRAAFDRAVNQLSDIKSKLREVTENVLPEIEKFKIKKFIN